MCNYKVAAKTAASWSHSDMTKREAGWTASTVPTDPKLSSLHLKKQKQKQP